MKNMNILITGGAGYIGTALADTFVSLGHKVTVFDNLYTGQQDKVPEQARLVVGDVTNIQDVIEVMADADFSIVVHLAALKAVGEGEENPGEYYRVNVLGTMNVLEAMKEHQVPSIIFSSTAAVYKPNGTGIYTETDALQAESVYGSTKIMCEELIKQYARLGYVHNYTIFRYFNLAGDTGVSFRDTQAQNVFPVLAHAALQQHTFSIFGDDYDTPDGTAVRDYIHLADLVDAHVRVLSRAQQEIINLGTNNGTSVRELVRAFEEIHGDNVPYEVQPRRAGDVARAVADCTKARDILEWKAERELQEMVQSTLDVYGQQ